MVAFRVALYLVMLSAIAVRERLAGMRRGAREDAMTSTLTREHSPPRRKR
jgi:hypothetical protein